MCPRVLISVSWGKMVNTLATWCEEPTYWKRLRCWERLRAGEEGNRGWDVWIDQINGHEFEQTPGDGEGQGSLVCYSPWGRRVRHGWATEPQQQWLMPVSLPHERRGFSSPIQFFQNSSGTRWKVLSGPTRQVGTHPSFRTMWIPWGPPLFRNSSVSPAHPWPSLPGSLGFSQAQRTNMHSFMIKAPAAALLGKGVGAAREELGTWCLSRSSHLNLTFMACWFFSFPRHLLPSAS